MLRKGAIRKGEYFDSVTLMTVGRELSGMRGVLDAAVVMGTRENRAILENAGLMVPEFSSAGEADLMVAVKAVDEKAASSAVAAVDALLDAVKKRKSAASPSEARPRSLDAALKVLPGADLALISVAGRFAGQEARKALESGLHVMLFSDNVPLETEIELKRYARERGLLLMGPDCGTAIINGAPLGFANVVRRGDIGIVAAAGTGLQEVSSILSCEGAGVSQAIGTGGRDVKENVGGIMFLEGIKALAQDEGTKVLLLVSKPPAKSVLKAVLAKLKTIKKPVVAVFLGAEPELLKGTGIVAAQTLEEGALAAVLLSKEGKKGLASLKKVLAGRRKQELSAAKKAGSRLKKGRRYLRGLFSGGTFCAEAQVLFKGRLTPLYSNAPTAGGMALEDSLTSREHTVVDLGEDEFTVGRPHPMIDYSLRNRRILEESKDPAAAVLLLDVVLGYGSNMRPAQELVPVLREAAKRVAVVCSVTGTPQDPQGKLAVEAALRKAGAVVMPTNASACRLAADIVETLEAP
ncbi:MAG: acyl-CoA synthetase FdrA [Elusimicrobiota bacterium]